VVDDNRTATLRHGNTGKSVRHFVVEGPGGKKVLGSGVLPLSQIESAIKSVQ